jgi:hypothetical protein
MSGVPQAKIDSLVVEEQLLKLLLQLNPQVHPQVKGIIEGTRGSVNMHHPSSARYSLSVESGKHDPDGHPSQQPDLDDDDFVSDDSVKKLICSIKPRAPKINTIFRERLLRIFERYDRYRLPTVSRLLRQYEGHEDSLFAALEAQYGPEPTIRDPDYFNEDSPPLPSGWKRLETLRGDIYYKHQSGHTQWYRPRDDE